MKFFVLDERHVWFGSIIKAAKARGYSAKRIFRGDEVDAEGAGFIRPHADPVELKKNQRDYDLMAARLTLIQDETQVRLYENKSAQFERWSEWMPPTWRFADRDAALAFCESSAPYPLVSKADVGASSVNVRILRDRYQAIAHVASLFGAGVEVNHCSGKARSMQKGYALLQKFIPHTVTWRVNAVGTKRAAFRRYCYPDRSVAQTGNVEPVTILTPQVESLLDFSNKFLEIADTKWCAIDVLQDGDSWRLLETSLAWPWPSPGKCNEAPFFGTSRRWIEMFDLMMDELEAGTWQKKH
jgi:glutathione synthase/RimK-type ligase-like ATP-grasp enzyme